MGIQMNIKHKIHFAIRRDAYGRCYQIVMFKDGKEDSIPVQANIGTLDKAEVALRDWIRRETEVREQETNVTPTDTE